MNVLDHLKTQTVEQIKDYCSTTCIDAGVAMLHVNGDYNLSTLVRNANFFGFAQVMYVGGSKNWDRRGSVGTHHYTNLMHIKTEEQLMEYIDDNGYELIAVENNIPEYSHKTDDLFAPDVFYGLGNKPLFVFGEEQCGLSKYILDNCKKIVTIEAYGSVRSLNVGTTSGIVMAFYRNYYNQNYK